MPETYFVPACSKEIKVLYEDKYLLLIEKPEFLLSVPGKHPRNNDSVITRLQKNYPSARIVHRLDLDTSGIMLIPLGADMLGRFGRLFQLRKIEKEYEALIYGKTRQKCGCIDLPIAPDWQHRPRQKIDFINGRTASTYYQTINRAANKTRNATRVLLRPHTGRSHQLRIHLRSIGHPILGCDLYAHEAAYAMSSRLMLHATRLAFFHPATGERLDTRSTPVF